MNVAHISKRGTAHWMTIPRKVGEELGLSDGSLLSFVKEDGKIFIENLHVYGEE